VFGMPVDADGAGCVGCADGAPCTPGDGDG